MNPIDPELKERAYDLARKINSCYRPVETDVTVNELAMHIMDFHESEAMLLRQERDTLAEWKRQQLGVTAWWAEIDTFVRNHPHAVLGHHVSAIALEWLHQRDTQCGIITRLRREIDELQAKVEDLS